jgi:large subunit ribosomal protein L31
LHYDKLCVSIELMKKDIHPQSYRPVVFEDVSNGAKFLVGSTVKTSKKVSFEGAEYDACEIEISSASHPFYTGKETILDTAGRVDKFKQRQAKAKK